MEALCTPQTVSAFAVTLQGLSLDCAMMDLSNKAGMAYVPSEKTRESPPDCFTEQAIKVSSKCLEINRLRQTYRPDLPQYTIPREPQPQKRKQKQNISVLLSPKIQKVK